MTKPILVIIGPSGVGKSTLASKLLDSAKVNFVLVPKYTTRPQREIEKRTFSEDIFVSDEEFDRLVGQKFFIDTVQPFNLPYRYGLPWPDLKTSQTPLVLLRSFVLDLFGSHYTELIIYQLETSFDIAKKRMQMRGQTVQDIQARMKIFKKEIQDGRKLASRVFQNEGDINSLAARITDNFLSDITNLI